jgi:hypothetical protein
MDHDADQIETVGDLIGYIKMCGWIDERGVAGHLRSDVTNDRLSASQRSRCAGKVT